MNVMLLSGVILIYISVLKPVVGQGKNYITKTMLCLIFYA